MENNTQETAKTPNNGTDGCLLGCLGIIVGIVILIISNVVLYNAVYDEYSPVDPDGDYILDNPTQELPVGTWVIESPYYFVHKEATVKEMENWRQTKLIISEDGTFELIHPTALLAKLLLVPDFKLMNRDSLKVPVLDDEVVGQAMNSSIVGLWSKQTDEKNKSFFAFQTDENNLPQRIQIANVKENSIKEGRLVGGTRLHWSIYSHALYPKEGVVWKKF